MALIIAERLLPLWVIHLKWQIAGINTDPEEKLLPIMGIVILTGAIDLSPATLFQAFGFCFIPWPKDVRTQKGTS